MSSNSYGLSAGLSESLCTAWQVGLGVARWQFPFKHCQLYQFKEQLKMIRHCRPTVFFSLWRLQKYLFQCKSIFRVENETVNARNGDISSLSSLPFDSGHRQVVDKRTKQYCMTVVNCCQQPLDGKWKLSKCSCQSQQHHSQLTVYSIRTIEGKSGQRIWSNQCRHREGKRVVSEQKDRDAGDQRQGEG